MGTAALTRSSFLRRGAAGKPAVGKAFGPALQNDALTSVLDLYER